MDGVTAVPIPANEPVHSYVPGSPERARLRSALRSVSDEHLEIPHVIGGVEVRGAGAPVDVVEPHRHSHVLGTFATAPAKTLPGRSRQPRQQRQVGASCRSTTELPCF